MEQMKRIGDKEEKKGIKAWFQKNGTKVALGVVTVGGLCLSRYAYKLGYDNGHYDGYDKGFKDAATFQDDFEITKVEIVK